MLQIMRAIRNRTKLPSSVHSYTTPSLNSPPPSRAYFYTVDHHGQLFLSNTRIRNFTSCYKDPAFLDFFYSRIRLNDTAEVEAQTYRSEGYEFVSPCGMEINYVKPDDAVLVYQKLLPEGASSAMPDLNWELNSI